LLNLATQLATMSAEVLTCSKCFSDWEYRCSLCYARLDLSKFNLMQIVPWGLQYSFWDAENVALRMETQSSLVCWRIPQSKSASHQQCCSRSHVVTEQIITASARVISVFFVLFPPYCILIMIGKRPYIHSLHILQ
jgi:hypothetical protein